MYTILQYGNMFMDQTRMNAYIEALRRAVTSESVVLDIGTGTGIFALLACQMGARHVYAIEPDSVIQVGRDIAAVNGYADRMTFIQNMSTKVTLPELADVLISDLSGVLPWLTQHIPSIIDARHRLLADGGAIIPQVDNVYVSIAEVPEHYGRLISPWNEKRYGLDMQVAKQLVTNNWGGLEVSTEQLLAQPQCVATLDYRLVNASDMHTQVLLNVARPGTGHGLIAWFERTVDDGLYFSNAPDAPSAVKTTNIYGMGFFPWSHPVDLVDGDTIVLMLQANLIGDDYVWRWETQVKSPDETIKASFKQSTLFGIPLSLTELQKQEADFIPALNEDGRIDHFVLSLMDGQLSLEEIARRTATRFPVRFHRWQDALSRVSDIGKRYD